MSVFALIGGGTLEAPPLLSNKLFVLRDGVGAKISLLCPVQPANAAFSALNYVE